MSNQEREFRIVHRKQENQWGCAWYAAFAITQDEYFLQQKEDVSHLRWLIHWQERGFVVQTVYKYTGRPMKNNDWDEVFTNILPGGDRSCFRLIISIPSRGIKHALHTVAALLFHTDDGERRITISDSLREDLVMYDLETFRTTEYADAEQVFGIYEAELDRWDHQSAEESYHRKVSP